MSITSGTGVETKCTYNDFNCLIIPAFAVITGSVLIMIRFLNFSYLTINFWLYIYMYAYAYLRCTSSLPVKQDFERNMLGSESSVLNGSSSTGYTRSLLLRVWKGVSVKPRKQNKKNKIISYYTNRKYR